MPLLPESQAPPAGAILDRLHDIQTANGCLSREDLKKIAEDLGVSLSRLYHCASFYDAFSFEPKGRHTIRICMGTACHIRGGEKVLEKLTSRLNIQPGETSEDRRFTLEKVHCVGACSMSPVLCIDAKTQGRISVDKIERLIKPYLEEAWVPENGKGGDG